MIERYESRVISDIWSRGRQIRMWAMVELAWIYQHSETGWMDAMRRMIPTPAEVADRERSTHHEFVAFLEVWSERFESDEAQRWVHFGLTSSDVIDTVTVVQIRDTHLHLVGLAQDLEEDLTRVQDRVGDLLQVGRTHGQWAQPRPLSVQIVAYRTMLRRRTRALIHALTDLSEGDFSGPTGGRHMLDEAKVNQALHSMGLPRADVSTQILLRDTWTHWARCLVGLLGVCEAIADWYWMLAQSEIGEVEVTNGAGSSAMPHKRGNPHRAENVRGLVRTARSLAGALDESVVQRGDRDLAHSSAERIVIPDLAHLAATVLTRTSAICQDYQFAPERIEANLCAALSERVDSAVQVSELIQEAGLTRSQAIRKIHG